MTCIDLMSKHSKLRSKYNDLHRFHVKTIKTTQNYKNDQITMYCIDLTSKRSKMLRFVAKHSKQQQNYKSNQITTICIDLTSKRSKQLKTTKTIKLRWIASIWRQTIKNVELRRNAFKTTQNYKSNQITMTCIDLMSKHSKLQKWSKYKDLHRFHVKPIKTTQNYKSDQITMYCIEFQNDQKCCVSSQNIQNNAKLQK